MNEVAIIVSVVALILSALGIARGFKEQQPPQILQVLGRGEDSIGRVLVHRVVTVTNEHGLRYNNGTIVSSPGRERGVSDVVTPHLGAPPVDATRWCWR